MSVNKCSNFFRVKTSFSYFFPTAGKVKGVTSKAAEVQLPRVT